MNKIKIILVSLFVVVLIILLSVFRCTISSYIDLVDDYYIDTWKGQDYHFLCAPNGILLITAHILDYDYDSNFIIVAQRPWNIFYNFNTTIDEERRNFKQSKFVQYWIVTNKERCIVRNDSIIQLGYSANVFGPFQKEEFQHQRKEMGVPDSLHLKY